MVAAEPRGPSRKLSRHLAPDDLSRLQLDDMALAKGLGGEPLVEVIRLHSHTCYLGRRDVEHEWGFGCGACPACELRANGWHDWVGQGRPALAP